jgi:uncharacterized protein (DUF302 family)
MRHVFMALQMAPPASAARADAALGFDAHQRQRNADADQRPWPAHRLQSAPSQELTMSRYAFGKAVALSVDVAVEKVTQALAVEGFGVLTEIDVAATLKKKLGQEMPPYRILGACNPKLASRAIAAEPAIGALLPCNVVVRADAAGITYVEFMDPDAVLTLVDRAEVSQLAAEVRASLVRALGSI